MPIDLTRVRRIPITGRGDMGLVTSESSPARILVTSPLVLLAVAGQVSGGSGIANLTVQIDHLRGPRYDRTLHTLEDVGTGTGGNTEPSFRVTEQELAHYLFFAGDAIVLNWTDPDGSKLTDWVYELIVQDI